MDPLFSIGVVSRIDWVSIIAQVLSAGSVLAAAIYAGSYPKRKDKIERAKRVNFILGRLINIDRKLEFFLTNIDKEIQAGAERDVNITVALIRTVCNAFKIDEDIDFLISHEEDITSYLVSNSFISEVTLNYQLFRFSLNKELMLNPSKDYLESYIQELKGSLNTVYRGMTWTIRQVEMFIKKTDSEFEAKYIPPDEKKEEPST